MLRIASANQQRASKVPDSNWRRGMMGNDWFAEAMRSIHEGSANVLSPPRGPDIVADSRELFGKSSNRYDTLKRERLPLAMYSMELELRDHPVAMFQRFLIANFKLTK